MVRYAGEQIWSQANANSNKKTWGDIMVNVKDYGARGDGVSDDTAKIQKAIDYAVSNGLTTIFFPKGVYKVTSLINLDKVDLIGENARFSGIADIIYDWGKAPKDAVFAKFRRSKFPDMQHIGFPVLADPSEFISVHGFPEFKPCFDSNGLLWAPIPGNFIEYDDSRVAVIDTATNTLIKELPTEVGSFSCQYDPRNHKVWVFCSGYTKVGDMWVDTGPKITICDIYTLEVVKTIDLHKPGAYVSGGCYDPSTGYMWCGDNRNSGKLWKINTSTYTIDGEYSLLPSYSIADICYCPLNGRLYISCYLTHTVVVFNSTTGTIVSAIDTQDGDPIGIVYEPVTRSIMVGHNVSGLVSKIDPLTNAVVAKITTSAFDPYGLNYDPTTGYVMVMMYSTATVDFIDPIQNMRVYSVNTEPDGGAQGMIADVNKPGVVWTMGNGHQQIRKIYVGEGRVLKEYDASNRHYAYGHIEKVQSLTYASNTTIDAAKGSLWYITLTGTITWGYPDHGVEGQTLTIHVTQDSVGGRSMNFDGSIQGGAAISQSGNTSNKQMIFRLTYINNLWRFSGQTPYY